MEASVAAVRRATDRTVAHVHAKRKGSHGNGNGKVDGRAVALGENRACRHDQGILVESETRSIRGEKRIRRERTELVRLCLPRLHKRALLQIPGPRRMP